MKERHAAHATGHNASTPKKSTKLSPAQQLLTWLRGRKGSTGQGPLRASDRSIENWGTTTGYGRDTAVWLARQLAKGGYLKEVSAPRDLITFWEVMDREDLPAKADMSPPGYDVVPRGRKAVPNDLSSLDENEIIRLPKRATSRRQRVPA